MWTMSTRSRSSSSASVSYPERPKAPANSSRRFLSRDATATSTAFGYSRIARARLNAEYQWPSPATATRQTRLIVRRRETHAGSESDLSRANVPEFHEPVEAARLAGRRPLEADRSRLFPLRLRGIGRVVGHVANLL